MVIEASMPDHQFPSPMPEEQERLPADSAPAPPPASEPEPEPEPAVTLSGNLSERARLDRQRMRAAGEGWTLQFATLCSRESAERKLAALNGYERFYLLPARVNDRDCHRLCWGLYPSREAALAARGLPRQLTEIEGKPAAMPIDKVAR
jgi:septal ring-binding cell division protein DamX